MKYRYKRFQIGKSLGVPKDVQNRIFSNCISFRDVLKYHLEDKIPISCIIRSDRIIVEKYGIEVCRELDWDLLSFSDGPLARSVLNSIDPSKDVVKEFYNIMSLKINPRDFTPKMREHCSDKIVEISDSDSYADGRDKRLFNEGNLPLFNIIESWHLFKDKDLTYCLERDPANTIGLKTEEVRAFMDEFKEIGVILSKTQMNTNLYQIIRNLYTMSKNKSRDDYVKLLMDNIFSYIRKSMIYNLPCDLSKEGYEILFKYKSVEEFVRSVSKDSDMISVTENFIRELNSLPPDYLYTQHIPFNVLCSKECIRLMGTYGIKTIVDFDRNNDFVLSKDKYRLLLNLYSAYVKYGGSLDKTISLYLDVHDRPYTDEEFNEVVRRMVIKRVPTNYDFKQYRIDPNALVDFKQRNKDLYLPDDAPDDLKEKYYSGTLKPKDFCEHRDYIDLLAGRVTSTILEPYLVFIDKGNNPYDVSDLYTFLFTKGSYEEIMNFLADYSEILEIVYNHDHRRIILNVNDSLEVIKNKIIERFKEILIENRVFYPSVIPEEIIKKEKDLFFPKDAPEELKKALFLRYVSIDYVLEHPEYYDYYKSIKLELICKHIPFPDKETNLCEVIKTLFKEDAFDIYCSYGKYLENALSITRIRAELKDVDISSKSSFLDSIEKLLYKSIIDGDLYYDENMPQRFKDRYPQLFINKDLDPELKEKFYQKRLGVEDFKDSSLFDALGDVSICLGLHPKYAWIGNLFADYKDQKEANKIRLNLIEIYAEVISGSIKMGEIVKNYILNNIDSIDYKESLRLKEHLITIVKRIRNSNSIEISNFGESILNTILKFDNPEEKFDEIEGVFLKNNLPMFAKVFTCFKLLYPDFTKGDLFDFSEDSRVAPQLIKPSIRGFGVINSDVDKRFQILFNDLFRISLNSNTYTLKGYIKNLRDGNELCLKLLDKSIKFEGLDDEQKQILEAFISKLEVIYEVSNNNHKNISNLSLEEKYKFLIREYKPTHRYSLVDRIVRSYGFYLGIESLEDLEQIIEKNIIKANIRNKQAPQKLVIHNGDFIRSIGNLDSVGGSLRYGNVCKELLGPFTGTSNTDTTPLDVDWTYIVNDESLIKAIDGSPTGWGFGNVFIYMKHDNPHLNITRDQNGEIADSKYEVNKAEMFCSSTSQGGYETHWGVRSGIATTDIDAIIFKEDRMINSQKPYNEDGTVNYDGEANSNELPAIKYEVAKNGVYIPIYNLSGDLIFTPKEFDSIRSRMNGLSYYGFDHFETNRDDLLFAGIEDIVTSINNDNNIVKERTIIRAAIEEIIKSKINVTKFNKKLTGDLTEGVVELIETGSTSRNSNVPGDSDFDFMLKIDRKDLVKTEDLIKLFTEIFKPDRIIPGRNNRFRGEGILVPGINRKVDIDISIDQKRNKYDYSSEMALNERYEAIKRDNPDDYQLVLANIIKAKKLLKEAGCYKSSKSDPSQGGLSGLGVENWILQNGGSLYLAAKDFLKHVYKNEHEKRSFEEFKEVYTVWDFGANHEPREKDSPEGPIRYPYDEFVSDNMNATGYNRMIEVLEKYVMVYDKDKIERYSNKTI